MLWKEVDTMKCALLSMALAASMLGMLVGCNPKEIYLEITSSQLQEAYKGHLIPISIRCEVEYIEPFVAAKRRILEATDSSMNISSNDAEIVTLAEKIVESSGGQLSALLNDTCRFQCSANIVESNLVVRIIIHKLATLGTEEALATKSRADQSLIEVSLLDYYSRCKGRQVSLRTARDAMDRIQNAANECKRMHHTFTMPYVDLHALLVLGPEFYWSKIYSFVGDNFSQFEVVGDSLQSGTHTNVIWRIGKDMRVCVTNSIQKSAGTWERVFVDMPSKLKELESVDSGKFPK